MADQTVDFQCVGGLDLRSPKRMAAPGTLLDCLNYEVDADGGYSLIKGPLPWDGQHNLSRTNFVYVEATASGNDSIIGSNLDVSINSISEELIAFPIGGDSATSGETSKFILYNNRATIKTGGSVPQLAPSVGDTLTVSGTDYTITVVYEATRENREKGLIPYEAFDAYYYIMFQRQWGKDGNAGTSTGVALPEPSYIFAEQTPAYCTGLFWFQDQLYAAANNSVNSTTASLYTADTDGWASVDMGQEMAFDNGQLSMDFEDYIVWNGGGQTSADSLGNIFKGGTSSGEDLDYFPGQIIYYTSAGDEYWATVTSVYKAKGDYYTPQLTAAAVATTSPINDLTAARSGDVIDGYTTQANDRVLVKNQSDFSENGVWVFTAGSAPTRATDFDTDTEAAAGTIIPVTNGTKNRNTSWVLINDVDADIGVNGLIFARDQQAEGALTIYDPYKRESSVTASASSGDFAVSQSWSEANAVNFTDGQNEPAIGDQITDGTVTMTVLKVIVDDGTWGGSPAAQGTLVCGAMSGGTTISSGAAITNTTQGGEDVCDTANEILDSDRDTILTNTSTNVAVTLPGITSHSTNTAYLQQETYAQYQSVVHNFKATTSAGNPTLQKLPDEAIYIATGTGFALEWNGTHLTRIRTGAIVSQDKPRHVSIHANRLCLGYEDGTVSMSVEGQPKNFSGVEGALTFGFGSKITGLLALNGDTTAVFTEDSVHMLQGTNDQNMVAREIAQDSGAIEYTAVWAGMPIYCDRHGIATLSQTEAYGDFARERISEPIRPALRKHLRRENSSLWGYTTSADTATNTQYYESSVAFAYALPSKNQYRLVMKDGTTYCCTLWNNMTGNQPVFTKLQVFPKPRKEPAFTGADFIAYCTGVDSDDNDCIFVSNVQKDKWCLWDDQDAGSTTKKRYSPGDVIRLDYTPILYGTAYYLIFNPIYGYGSDLVSGNMHTLVLQGKFKGHGKLDLLTEGIDPENGGKVTGVRLTDNHDFTTGWIKTGTYGTPSGDLNKELTMALRTDAWEDDAHFSVYGHAPARGEALKITIGRAKDTLDGDLSQSLGMYYRNFAVDGLYGETPHTIQSITIPTMRRRTNLS